MHDYILILFIFKYCSKDDVIIYYKPDLNCRIYALPTREFQYAS